jgi:serine/threonine-protein kinase HipA
LASLLQASEARDADLRTLLQAQLLFWMLAATDGHAKNFSLHLLAQGRFRLTPLYDVLSAWPVAGAGKRQIHPKKLKLAMSLRGSSKHYRIAEIQRRHFNMAAQQCGHGANMEDLIEQTLGMTDQVIERVAAELPVGFPAALFAVITRGLSRAAAQLAAMPKI